MTGGSPSNALLVSMMMAMLLAAMLTPGAQQLVLIAVLFVCICIVALALQRKVGWLEAGVAILVIVILTAVLTGLEG